MDRSEIGTVVVPAREDGFEETFLGEDRWWQIRLHTSMIPKINYIAAYRIAPIKAITHVASVKNIESWENSGKYVVNFEGPARKLDHPIKLVPNSNVPMRSPRYTSYDRLMKATTLDEVF